MAQDKTVYRRSTPLSSGQLPRFQAGLDLEISICRNVFVQDGIYIYIYN